MEKIKQLGLVFLFIGGAFKMNSFPFSNMLVTIGFTVLAIYYTYKLLFDN